MTTKTEVPRPNTICEKFSGGSVERATPVPIPNTEVKPLGADGTARATAWESRKPPGLLNTSPLKVKLERAFFVWDELFVSINIVSLPSCQNDKIYGTLDRSLGSSERLV